MPAVEGVRWIVEAVAMALVAVRGLDVRLENGFGVVAI